MPANDPTDPSAATNYFRGRRNQYMKSTLQLLTRENPFRNLVPCRQYAGEEGENPTIVTYTSEMPTSYPFKVAAHTPGTMGMETIKRSNHPANYPGENPGDATDPNSGVAGNPLTGTLGNPSSPEGTTHGSVGNPASHKIRRGQIERTFEIRETSFSTETMNLDDIKRAWQAAQQAEAFESSLKNYMTVFWSDWYRVQNIGMGNNKYVPNPDTGAASIGYQDTNNYEETFAGAFAGSGYAAAGLVEWKHLKQIYYRLCRKGATKELAVGQSANRPIFPLHCSPELKEYLWKDEDRIGETLKWHDPKSLLAVMGYDRGINGFTPYVDLFPMRFADDAALAAGTPVYPTQNVAASFGYDHDENTAWNSAKYEVATILPQQVYECVYEPSSPIAFADMQFDPQDYTGEFRFINTPTFEGTNDRGNKGYYLADVRIGSKPIYPQFGVSIVYDRTLLPAM